MGVHLVAKNGCPHLMSSITSAKTIEKLRLIFSTHGLPMKVVTDNGPSFTSATLLMGRRLRSQLDRVSPDVTPRVERQQLKQAEQHDNSKPLRTFAAGDQVYVKDFTTTPHSWITGTIVKATGPVSYQVELLSGLVVRRHVDAVRRRDTQSPPSPPTDTSSQSTVDDIYLPDLPPVRPAPLPPVPVAPPPPVHVPPAPRTRQTRSRPDYFDGR